MKKRPSDEELGRALRAHAREQEALADDPRWDALARGDAAPDEVAELERMAESDPAAREMLALFRPVGGGAQDRYAAAIAAEIAGGPGTGSATGSAPVPERPADSARHAAPTPERPADSARHAAPPPAAPEDRAPPLDPVSKRRVMRWLAPVSAAVAIAAAAAIFVATKTPDGGLPAYAITLAGGEATSRSEPSEPTPALAPGSRFTITLRPATAVKGPLGARVFLVQGERVELVEAEIKVSADGAVRLAGRLATQIQARPGDAEIVAVVARPEALPSKGPGAGELADGGGRRVLRRPVRIAEPR